MVVGNVRADTITPNPMVMATDALHFLILHGSSCCCPYGMKAAMVAGRGANNEYPTIIDNKKLEWS